MPILTNTMLASGVQRIGGAPRIITGSEGDLLGGIEWDTLRERQSCLLPIVMIFERYLPALVGRRKYVESCTVKLGFKKKTCSIMTVDILINQSSMNWWKNP